MKPSGIIYIFRDPLLTPEQFNRLSNIFDNIGTVFLAVGVIGPLFTSVDRLNWLGILVGSIASVICWIMSLLIAKKSANYE